MSHNNYSENSAINLSTSQVPRSSNSAANGNGDCEDSQSSVRKLHVPLYILYRFMQLFYLMHKILIKILLAHQHSVFYY